MDPHIAENDNSSSLPKIVPNAQRQVLDYIESTFNRIIENVQIRPCGQPHIILKRITKVRSHAGNSLGVEIEDKEIKISFPGKNKDEALRFSLACVGKILSEIYTALNSGEIVTKRDIYYRDPKLFRSQSLVDRYVDMVAYTCGVTRLDLNITASPKGFVAGLRDTGEQYQIVPDKNIEQLREYLDGMQDIVDWRWILVVEKEATFKSLIESDLYLGNEIVGRGLLITGKGYPDLATRRFLRACVDYKAYSTHPYRAPVLSLFDCDPDGINILDIYRHGSRNLPHESATCVPEIQWIGLRPHNVFGCKSEDIVAVPLSSRDTAKVRSMLITDVEPTLVGGLGVDSRTALQWMKLLNRKAEIQTLEDLPGGMDSWLLRRVEEVETNANPGV